MFIHAADRRDDRPQRGRARGLRQLHAGALLKAHPINPMLEPTPIYPPNHVSQTTIINSWRSERSCPSLSAPWAERPPRTSTRGGAASSARPSRTARARCAKFELVGMWSEFTHPIKHTPDQNPHTRTQFPNAHIIQQGLFLGVSLEGTVILSRPAVNRAFYGAPYSTHQLLLGQVGADARGERHKSTAFDIWRSV